MREKDICTEDIRTEVTKTDVADSTKDVIKKTSGIDRLLQSSQHLNLIDKQQILHEAKSLFATIKVLHNPQQNMPVERELVNGTSVVFCNSLCQNFPSSYSTATYGTLFSRKTTLPYWGLLPFSLGITF